MQEPDLLGQGHYLSHHGTRISRNTGTEYMGHTLLFTIKITIRPKRLDLFFSVSSCKFGLDFLDRQYESEGYNF